MRGLVSLVLAAALIGSGFVYALVAPEKANAADRWLAIVRLQTDVAVRGPDIYLGEIAEIDTDDEQLRLQLESLVVGRAALPGQRRDVHGAAVQTRMRQQRLPVKDVLVESEGPEVVVYTRSSIVSEEMLVDRVLTALAEQARLPVDAGGENASMDLQCVSPGPLLVSDGELAVHVRRLSGSTPGSVVASVDILSDDALERSVMVRCEAVLELEVLVTTAALKRHDRLEHDAYEIQVRRFSTLPRRGFFSDDTPSDWRVTRPLAPGSVLTLDMVEPLPVVKQGAVVTIVAEVAGIVVTAPGVALVDGELDEFIRVENSLSGQKLRARVVDGETVVAVMH